MTRFNKKSFLDDFNTTNWNYVISFNNTYLQVNPLIMSHVPMKKLNKQQLKFIQKPWFTKAMQNSIQKKKLIKNTF